MIFHHRMCGLVSVRRNAFGASDINEGLIVGLVRLLRYFANDFEFGCGIAEALVPPGDVVVDFNPEYIASLRALYDVVRVAAFQAIGADAHVVRPILSGRIWNGGRTLCEHEKPAHAKGQRREQPEYGFHE